MNWDVITALGWVLFGGWILSVETIEFSNKKKRVLGYRHSAQGRRHGAYLQMAWAFWLFVLVLFLTWKGSI